MKKLFLIGAIVIAMLTVSGLQYKAQAGEVDGCNACYKKKNGQLRLVSGPDECLKSEKYINLCQPSGNSTGQLACVTAMMKDPTESSADIRITNQKNITVSDVSEVFNPIYVQQNPNAPLGEVYWGLQCNDAWVNTGCNQSVEGSDPQNVDLPQYENGCFSDDEEISYLIIFTTCCQVVQ